MKLPLSLMAAGVLSIAGGCDDPQADAKRDKPADAAELADADAAAPAMAVAAEPTPLALSQTEEPAVDQQQPAEEQREAPAADAEDEEGDAGGGLDPEEEARRLEAAQLLLGEVSRAYQSAPALVDEVTARQWVGATSHPVEELVVRFGAGKEVEVKSGQTHLISTDGFFYATRPGSDRYVKAPLEEDLLETSRDVLVAPPGMFIQFCFRYGKSPDLLMHALTLGSQRGEVVRVSNYRRITDNEGTEFEQLTLLAASGSVVINVDPETKFIRNLEVDFVPPDAPVANLHIRQQLEFNPKVYDELPSPISFDTEGKREVRTWRQVMGLDPLEEALTIEKGQEAPDFTLYTLEGRKVVLSELKGKPVLLYFWAVNNVPSLKNIYKLSGYLQWLQSSDQPVEFYPICTLSISPLEERWEEALKKWESTQLSEDCLIDLENEIAEAWGITAGNVLVVVDHEGRVSEVVLGLSDATVVEKLKELTEKATAEAGGGGNEG